MILTDPIKSPSSITFSSELHAELTLIDIKIRSAVKVCLELYNHKRLFAEGSMFLRFEIEVLKIMLKNFKSKLEKSEDPNIHKLYQSTIRKSHQLASEELGLTRGGYPHEPLKQKHLEQIKNTLLDTLSGLIQP